MATIKLPDGRTINFPDSMSKEEVQEALSTLSPQEDNSRNSGFALLDNAANNLRAFTAEALNTASFGLSDVIAGAGLALAEELFGGEDKDPGREFNRPQEEREQFKETNPISSFAASFMGGFLNPVAQKAGKLISGAEGLFKTTGAGAVVGGGTWGRTSWRRVSC